MISFKKMAFVFVLLASALPASSVFADDSDYSSCTSACDVQFSIQYENCYRYKWGSQEFITCASMAQYKEGSCYQACDMKYLTSYEIGKSDDRDIVKRKNNYIVRKSYEIIDVKNTSL